jgi:hypothetical protein
LKYWPRAREAVPLIVSSVPLATTARISFSADGEAGPHYSDYRDFDGLKKATKVQSKRDGQDFLKSEVTEFKVVDKLDPKTFDEPE